MSRCVFDCGSRSPDVCLIAVPDRDVCLIVVLDLQIKICLKSCFLKQIIKMK